MGVIKSRYGVVSDIQGTLHTYKEQECAGKDCRNRGIHLLKVRFLNKSGLFCDSCKNDLVSHDLVYYSIQNSDNGRDKGYNNTHDSQKEVASEVVGPAHSNAQCNGQFLSRVDPDGVFQNDR